MATFEHVEKLRERANVSYDEAKAALDACGDDLLEAMIYLEKQGKVVPPTGGGCYSTGVASGPAHTAGNDGRKGHNGGESFTDAVKRFFRWCGKIINKGNTNMFQVWYEDKIVTTVPVTVLVLLLVFCFWVSIPLLIVGLFCGCRYRFSGRELEKTPVNDFMDTAASAADSIKTEVKNRTGNDKNEHKGGPDQL